jgi:hypothetical protein
MSVWQEIVWNCYLLERQNVLTPIIVLAVAELSDGKTSVI